MYRGQATLEKAIELYRRYLSGRGPLRRVSCTFHSTESCSSYGLRVSRESNSLGSALVLIRTRVRRCGTSALYRTDGPAPGLVWGELYDELEQPGELDTALRESVESEQTRRAVLLASGWVARQRLDYQAMAEARELLVALGGAGPRLRVRRAAALKQGLLLRLRWRLATAACLALAAGGVTAAVFEPRWPGAVVCGGLFATLCLCLARVVRLRQRRLENRVAVAEFSVF